MHNALASMAGSPPAPNPVPENAMAAAPAAPASAQPQGSPGQGGGQGQPGGMAPPPSHEQTVATLVHLGAIERELSGLLKDPDLGKSDLRSKFIDGAVKLVADGIMSPSDAVTQLGTLPDRPFEQKQWVMQHFAQTVQAQQVVVGHHQAGVQAGLVSPQPSDGGGYNPDNHQSIMGGVLKQYQSGGNA